MSIIATNKQTKTKNNSNNNNKHKKEEEEEEKEITRDIEIYWASVPISEIIEAMATQNDAHFNSDTTFI